MSRENVKIQYLGVEYTSRIIGHYSIGIENITYYFIEFTHPEYGRQCETVTEDKFKYID